MMDKDVPETPKDSKASVSDSEPSSSPGQVVIPPKGVHDADSAPDTVRARLMRQWPVMDWETR